MMSGSEALDFFVGLFAETDKWRVEKKGKHFVVTILQGDIVMGRAKHKRMDVAIEIATKCAIKSIRDLWQPPRMEGAARES